MDIEYLSVDHIGIAVESATRAAETFENVLGIPGAGGETLPERGLEVRFVRAGSTRLELISPTGPDSDVSRFLNKRGEGLHHVCLEVANIDRAIATLHESGAKLIDAEPRPGADGTRVAFIHPRSSHGVLLELVEKRHS